MPDFSFIISQQWFQLIIVAIFGFITGLELREYLQQRALKLNIKPGLINLPHMV
jgi:hypothetical protein